MKRRILTVGLILGCVFHPVTAAALTPPDPGTYTISDGNDGGTPKADSTLEQKYDCAVSVTLPGSDMTPEPPANRALNVSHLHKYATGKGVVVAVIDSGINPNSRLGEVKGGGDYLQGNDGLTDCDHHGTLVAGIIAAKPSATDQFVGVAPDVTLISIRQSSQAFTPKAGAASASGGPNLGTLAKAILRATNMGANIINVSITACFSATSPVETKPLIDALTYAQRRGVIVVTSAGNIGEEPCTANPLYSPSHPNDWRNWTDVKTVSMPSYYAPLVVSVGGSKINGQPSTVTLPGPWVTVAAPAEGIVSLDPADKTGKLVNAAERKEGARPFTGTSFSAAYVTGVLALLKQRYPTDSPAQLVARLTRTAQGSSLVNRNLVGAGVIDPLAALTVDTSNYPLNPGGETVSTGQKVDVAPVSQTDSWLPVALVVASVVLYAGGLVVALMISRIRKKAQ